MLGNIIIVLHNSNFTKPSEIGTTFYELTQDSGGSEVKASASNAGDPGSIPGSGRSPGEGNGTHSSTLAWRIPWTEKPGRLQFTGSQSRTRLSD